MRLAVVLLALTCCFHAAASQCPAYFNTPSYPDLVGGETAQVSITISVLPIADVTLFITSVNANVTVTPSFLAWTAAPPSPLTQTVTVSASAHASAAVWPITYTLAGTNSNTTTDYSRPNDGSVTLIPQRKIYLPSQLQSIMAGQSSGQQLVTADRPPIDVVVTPSVPDLAPGSITFTPPSLTFTKSGSVFLPFTAAAANGISGGSFPVVWTISGSNAASYETLPNSTLPIGCASGYNGTATTQCVDINECVTGTAVCSPFSSCYNTPGSYICTPFVWPNTLVVAAGNGVSLPGGVVLDDTLGGQVLSFRIDVGVGDVSVGTNSLFGWSGQRQFTCRQYWTNLTGNVVPPPANVEGFPIVTPVGVNATAYCITSPAIGVGLQLSVAFSTKGGSITGVGRPSTDTISFAPPTILPNTLKLDGASAAGSNALTAVNNFGETIRFDGTNFFPDPNLVTVLYRVRPSIAVPNPPYFKCTVDAVRTTATSLVCLTASNGAGQGLVFTVGASGVNVTGTDRYSYKQTPVITGITSWGCFGASGTLQPPLAPIKFVTGCPTAGGVLINVTGTGFLAPAAVIVNGVPCTFPVLGGPAPHAIDPVSGLELLYSLITCMLPAGTGAGQQMLVSSGELFSSPSPVVSYAAPSITGVNGCATLIHSLYTADCNREGNNILTIEGTNFGFTGASVRIGIADCLNVSHVFGFEHSRLTCWTPPGTAAAQPITVVQFNGQISTSPATMSYRLCSPGSFLLAGTTRCQDCSAGKFSPVGGATVCLDCSRGSFAANESNTACTPCPKNTVQSATGASGCVACPATQFQASIGQTECTPCSNNQYVSDPFATNPCLPCPVGAICDVYGVHALDGFYIVSTGPNAAVAVSGNPAGLGTLKAIACLPGLCQAATNCGQTNITCCGANRLPAEQNPLCGACLPGHTDVNGSCVACDKPNGGFLVLLLLASWVFVMIFHWLSSSKASNETKIFLYFIQGALLFFGGTTGLLSWASFVNFNIFSANNSSSPVCILPLTGLQMILLGFLVPLISLAQLWVMYAMRECCYVMIGRAEKRKRQEVLLAALETKAAAAAAQAAKDAQTKGNKTKTTGLIGASPNGAAAGGARAPTASVHGRANEAFSQTQSPGWIESMFDSQDYNQYIRTSVALFLFSYNALVNTIFEFLSCTTVTPGVSVVTSQPSISCESSDYAKVRAFMYAMLVLVVVLAPIIIVAALYVAYLLNRTIDPVFQTRYGLLFEGYKTQCFWFESYVLMRRVTLIALLVSLRNDGALFSWVSLANILFLFFHGAIRAYCAEPHNNLETYTLWIHCILTVMLATSHNPLTYNESLGFSCLIFVTAGVFILWLLYSKSLELLAAEKAAANLEKRRKRLVEMSYEQVALAAVNEEDILLVRLQDGTLARVYAPGLGLKEAQGYESKRQQTFQSDKLEAGVSYNDAMNRMASNSSLPPGGVKKNSSGRVSSAEEDACIVVEPLKPAPAPAPAVESKSIELMPLVPAPAAITIDTTPQTPPVQTEEEMISGSVSVASPNAASGGTGSGQFLPRTGADSNDVSSYEPGTGAPGRVDCSNRSCGPTTGGGGGGGGGAANGTGNANSSGGGCSIQ